MKVLNQKITDKWSVYQGDCIEVMKGIPSNSVHYSIFSPPFSSLFVYSDLDRDMGNSSRKEFFIHLGFLIPELHRVLFPGRLLSFHCVNMTKTIHSNGFIGIQDFRGDLIRLFESYGFIFHSEVVIWKDPLMLATRTKRLELAHKQICTDSSRCAQGGADYVITMRKPGENLEPVKHKRGFERYIGERPEPKMRKRDDPKVNKYSHHVWQRYASPVWFDIRQTNTLNVKLAREKDDERHICPLQLDVIARCLELWTNPDDIVLSPFAGIGSEGYVSIQMGRKFIGIELKESYYRRMMLNLISARKSNTLGLKEK